MDCFVCTDGQGAMYKMCNCTSLYVHEECFRELIKVPTHRTHCPLCTKAYPVTWSTKKKVNCTLKGMHLEVFVTNTIVAAGCLFVLIMFDEAPIRDMFAFWRYFILILSVFGLITNICFFLLGILVQSLVCLEVKTTETCSICFPQPLQFV